MYHKRCAKSFGGHLESYGIHQYRRRRGRRHRRLHFLSSVHTKMFLLMFGQTADKQGRRPMPSTTGKQQSIHTNSIEKRKTSVGQYGCTRRPT